MYPSIIVLLLSLTIVLSRNVTEKEWKDYKFKFEKRYTPAEDRMRKHIFSINVSEIDKHNEMHAKGKITFTKGVNQFTDMTQKEFEDIYLMKQNKLPEITESNVFKPSGKPIGTDIDWVKKGAVTPVKDQKKCGSCWTFATTGALEGANFIKNGQLVSLSEQQILDCDVEGLGCVGGAINQAFDYLMVAGGSEPEKTYPYVAKQEKCQFRANSVKVKVKGYKLSSLGEKNLYEPLSLQPVAIAVDAQDWSGYSGGIFQGGRSDKIDHGVLLVGSGSVNGTPYWLIKNSWGKYWGENGYIRLLRDNGTSGIGTFGCIPQVP